MDLRQLRTFRSVAELGSLSKASDRLRIAQPALSRQIKLLEHELRVPLFTRNGRGMALTEAGRFLLMRVGGIVRQLEQVKDDIASMAGSPSGEVVLGMVPTISALLAARLARQVIRDIPTVSLRIVEGYGGHLVDWLHRGEIDLAVTYGPAADLHLRTETLASEELLVIGPAGCGLHQRGEVAFEWLAQQKLVLPSKSHGLRALIDAAAARTHITLNILLEADSFRVLVDIIVDGLGYTLLPRSAVPLELEQRQLESARLVKPSISRELVLAFPNGQTSSIAAHAITALVRSDLLNSISPESDPCPEEAIACALRNA